MALVWSHTTEEDHYELRSAGATLRLYRNGVNHSQWNPNRPLGGSIWDLITLPALHRPVGSLKDVLMLGFGAGSVGRQLQELARVQRMVGVELDPIHLSIAEGFFECDASCFELISADAVEWVAASQEASYDLIIDDLYGEEAGVPERYAPTDSAWFRQLADRLRVGGLLVLNTIEPDRIQHLPLLRDRGLKKRFPYKIAYQIEGYENRVLSFSDRPFDIEQLRENFLSIQSRYPRCRGVERRYHQGPL